MKTQRRAGRTRATCAADGEERERDGREEEERRVDGRIPEHDGVPGRLGIYRCAVEERARRLPERAPEVEADRPRVQVAEKMLRRANVTGTANRSRGSRSCRAALTCPLPGLPAWFMTAMRPHRSNLPARGAADASRPTPGGSSRGARPHTGPRRRDEPGHACGVPRRRNGVTQRPHLRRHVARTAAGLRDDLAGLRKELGEPAHVAEEPRHREPRPGDRDRNEQSSAE